MEAVQQLPTDRYHRGWVTYFVGIHLLGLAGLGYVVATAGYWSTWAIAAFAVAYYFLCHLAITIEAHRYFAHRSFQAPSWFHYLMVILFAGVMQGPIIWWAGKHLLHHSKSDRPGEDPHTPLDGFWHAHCLWLMKERGLTQLPTKPMLAFRRPQFAAGAWQAKYHWPLGLTMAFVVPTLVGWLCGDVLGGFLIAGCLRLVFQYHLTWVVNSVGHYWGESSEKGGSATNQTGWWGKMLAVLTVGESNHAGHHDQPSSYRIGRGIDQWDPGAWVIERLAQLGVCYDLKSREVVPEAV